ncbi:MAG: methyl-accepting chemotaxis protein, partial [Marinilabiliaceae bacterium]|nr:methyl-accepting chemotaxis protein [Marinilabiliaceae bacterium]
MLKNKQVSLKQKIGIIIGIGIFMTTLILISYGTFQSRKEAISAAQNQAVAIANDFSANIQIILEEAMDASRAMANAMSAVGEAELHGEISRQEAVAMAEKVLFSNDDFLGFTFGFESQVFDSKDQEYIDAPAHDATGRFLSYLTKNEDGTALVDVLVDYETAEKGPWYWLPKQRMTDVLTEPIVYPVQGVDVTMVSCMTPVIYNGFFLGVTGIDYPIDFMQEQASSGDYYGGDFQMSIISHEGVYAANKNFPDRVNTNIKEFFPNEFESQINTIQAGESMIHSDDEFLNVFVPLQIARTGAPWQVRFSVPYSLITKHANSLMWNQIGIGFILVLLGIGLVVWYVSRLIKPIDGMVKMANAMAEGDLMTSVDVKTSNDEIGELIQSFTTMKTMIIDIVNKIKDGADQIAGASVQVSATSQQLSQGASEQASATEQVSSTMEQITSNINQNRDNAGQTEKITDVVAKG